MNHMIPALCMCMDPIYTCMDLKVCMVEAPCYLYHSQNSVAMIQSDIKLSKLYLLSQWLSAAVSFTFASKIVILDSYSGNIPNLEKYTINS